MSRAGADSLALRREALCARAALQRLQLQAALGQLRDEAVSPRRVASTALQVVRWLLLKQSAPSLSAVGARPWLLSAAWLAARTLRNHPSARWVTGIGLAAAAVWWFARVVRAAEPGPDDTG
jgi:hypothetical protein